MTTAMPSAGIAEPLAWIGAPGTIEGGDSLTLETCAPTAVTPAFDRVNGITRHPVGTSIVHPAGS
jgi:hypothetical protein